jgi:16S rRNA (guanine966-N2)-methyltransferase
MRITGGSLKGRKLKAPRGAHVEPMPDRVRESVFAILQNVLPGARVLDLFACTGSLGIEALSRGAVFAKDPATARTLEDNLELLGAGPGSKVVQGDALSLSTVLRSGEDPFDIAFLDPPYRLSDDARTLEQLETLITQLFEEGMMSPGAIVVFRQRREGRAPLCDSAAFETDSRIYGTTRVTFVEHRPQPNIS